MREGPLRIVQVRATDPTLDVIARWYQGTELRRWMGERFRFEDFRHEIGTVGGKDNGGHQHRLNTLALIGFDDADTPVAFLGADIKYWIAGRSFGIGENRRTTTFDGPPTFGFFYAVDDEHHRCRGYGTQMVNTALDLAPELRAEQIQCHVDAPNTGSLALLRRFPQFEETTDPRGGICFTYSIARSPLA